MHRVSQRYLFICRGELHLYVLPGGPVRIDRDDRVQLPGVCRGYLLGSRAEFVRCVCGRPILDVVRSFELRRL